MVETTILTILLIILGFTTIVSWFIINSHSISIKTLRVHLGKAAVDEDNYIRQIEKLNLKIKILEK